MTSQEKADLIVDQAALILRAEGQPKEMVMGVCQRLLVQVVAEMLTRGLALPIGYLSMAKDKLGITDGPGDPPPNVSAREYLHTVTATPWLAAAPPDYNERAQRAGWSHENK